MGSRALLHQAGLTTTWWPWAAPYYCDAQNILGKPGAQLTPHWRRQGKEFAGEVVPFGAEVQAIIPDARMKRHKFASRTE
eukprot:16437375-Heterocapsa_arctica.AAC.1